MALEVRRSSKEKNLPTMSPEELEAKLPEPDMLTVELNDFLSSVEKIRNYIDALSWTTQNDLLQLMATVINNPQKQSKAEVLKRIGICVQKGTKLIWTVYNELTRLQKEINDMNSSLHLQQNCNRRAASLFLRKIKQCHFSTLCHLLHENMLELVKQEQVCREAVMAFFASKDQRKAKTFPSKQRKVEPPMQQAHSQESLDKSSEQEVLEEAVVSLLYAVSQVNELMEKKDDLSDYIEYVVCAAAEELPKPPNNLHTQPRKASYPKKRETGCPVM